MKIICILKTQEFYTVTIFTPYCLFSSQYLSVNENYLYTKNTRCLYCNYFYPYCLFSSQEQSYIYQVLQTIQMKLILLCVWAEPAVLGSAKTALKFIYKIYIGYYLYTIQCMEQFISFKSKINNPWFNPWFILLHTHSNVCATVEARCLEYLVCITLPISIIVKQVQRCLWYLVYLVY